MKKILLYCAVLLCCIACERDELEPIPVEKSFEDPNVPLGTFKTQLLAGADGWKATIAPADGGLYGGYIKFENNGEARMIMDYSGSAASVPFVNKYTVNIAQVINPTLSIDKASAFGTFAATNNLDIDYTFKASSGDTLKLLGNTYGNALTLIKVAKPEADEYLAGRIINSANAIGTLNTYKLYFKRLTVGAKVYDLILNPDIKVVSLNYNENGTFKRFSTYFAYTSSGIIFKSPFIDGGVKIMSLSALQLNIPANTASLTAGTSAATITTAAAPLAVDLDAAQRFYNNPFGGFWASDFGFTVNGVRNAFNVNSIPGYTSVSYNPKYGSGYDALLFNYTVSGANRVYGPAFLTRLEANGKVVFHTYAGNFSNPASTSPGLPHTTTIANVRTQWLDAAGYYVIQSGPTSYDLVGAKDGTTWISFY